MVARISWIIMVVLLVVEVVALVVVGAAAAAVSVVLVYTSTSANNLCVRIHVREWAPILWRVRSRKVEHAS